MYLMILRGNSFGNTTLHHTHAPHGVSNVSYHRGHHNRLPDLYVPTWSWETLPAASRVRAQRH